MGEQLIQKKCICVKTGKEGTEGKDGKIESRIDLGIIWASKFFCQQYLASFNCTGVSQWTDTKSQCRYVLSGNEGHRAFRHGSRLA